ncbi:MAG TPA: hypothetical protein PLJ47_11455, partial [Candidatus Hydrogenedentes bacterium]|nr:hypothetical protein [Candidatus Hydrogenedentota bacterium]
PCLLILLAMFVPRFTLVIMWLTAYTSSAFETRLWPLLGFILMPYTTCAYAIGMNANGGFTGWSLVLLVVAIIFDLGSHGGSVEVRRRS